MLLGELVVVDAVNDRDVGAVGRAETITFLAPAVRCAEAFSLLVKMPVHSSTMSTPRSLCGSSAGFLTAVTLNGLPPTEIVSPGRPRRVGTSRAHCRSAAGAHWFRPVPQIVDRNHLDIGAAGLDDGAQNIPPDAAKAIVATRTAMIGSRKRTVRRSYNCAVTASATPLGVMPKILVKLLGWPRSAEAVHADEPALVAKEFAPAISMPASTATRALAVPMTLLR